MPSLFRPLLFAAIPCLSLSRIARAAAASLLPVLLAAGAHAATSPFVPMNTYPSGGAAQYTATADVNGDGKQDVFTSNLNGVISVLLGNGNGSFQAPKTIAALPGGSYPILTADFNHDGKPDLAVLEPGSARVLIYLGLGNGSFESPKSFPAGLSPRYMAVGDVNGDHNPDLIVTAGTPPSSATPSPVGFSILLGEGNGNFHSPVMITAQNGAAGILLTVGDVNNDGHLDVVTSDGQGNAEVFLGNGNGTFREQSSFGDGANGGDGQLLLADLYGQGKLDLVVGNFGFQGFPGTLILLQGNGDGTFSNATNYTAGFLPSWVSAADMNADGKLDLVVGNAFSNSVTVLINHGSGNFTSSPNNYATPYLESDLSTPTPGLLSLADFNGDGKPDVAVASIVGLDVLLNIGGGVLRAPASVEVGQLTGQIFATDFNSDGHLDLAVVTAGQVGIAVGTVLTLFGDGGGNFLARTPFLVEDPAGISALAGGYFNGNGKVGIGAYGFANQGIYEIDNQGMGSFTNGPSLNLPNQPPYLCAGDFNHDGYSDYAVLDGNEVDIYLNLHNGTFSGPVSYKLGLNPGFIVTRDLNGDGKLDLVATNNGSNDVSVLLGKGDGTFGSARSYPAGNSPNVVTTGDFNRDGKIDLAVGGGQATILLGRGDGTFAAPSSYPAHGPVTYLAQASLRGNGIEDLLAVSTDFSGKTIPTDIYLLSGKGDGSFASPVAYGAGADPYWLATGDFNGDGAPDVVVSTYYGSGLTLLLNQHGTRIMVMSNSASVKAGQSVTFTATLFASVPGSGQPAGTVAFKDGSRILGTANLANGKATFATAHLSPGAHTITAAYYGNNSFNPHNSTPITVKVGP